MPLSVGDYSLFSFNTQRSDTTSTGSTSGGGSQSFAPSVLPQLPEVVIRPPIAPVTQPIPSLGSRIVGAVGSIAGRIGGGILLLLTPMNSGPDGTGDLVVPPAQPQPQPEPEPEIEVLPEVVVRPPPPINTAPPPAANDPIMPPNWNDLAHPGDLTFEPPLPFSGPGTLWDLLLVPIPLPGNQPAPEPLSDPGELPFPSGPDVFPDVTTLPGSTGMPSAYPNPDPVLPGSFGFPDPFGIGSPLAHPDPISRPGVSPRPGGRPTTPGPIEIPLPIGFADPGTDWNPRPIPRPPGGRSLPEFFTDPSPDILADPQFDTDMPTSDDQCQCDQKPKKKKKPKTARAVCYQGTYTQRKKGISYAPKRVVPCAGEKKSKSKKPKSRRLKPGQFPMELFNA